MSDCRGRRRSDHLSRFRFGAAFSDNWDQPRVFVFRTDVIFGPHPSCYFVGVVPRGRTRVFGLKEFL